MSRLEISPEQFRAVAGRIAALAEQYLGELDSLPSFPAGISGSVVEQAFSQALPQEGLGAAAVEELADVLRYSRPPSPRFFGYVAGSGEPVAAAADLLASVLNQNVTAWRSAPAAVAIERTVVRWLAEAVGCPGFSGSLCAGGSSANLMGLAMAREKCLAANDRGAQPGVVYASTEAHMSIGKAVALLGLGRQNLRLIPVDAEFRLRPDELQSAIERDRASEKKLVAVVASAGTVNTGAIDPLPEIAALARRHGLWLHVDGAYGALAALAQPGKFAGLNLADSISLDPHKWLYQPIDCGCLLFRDAAEARAAFAHSGDYARALSQDPREGFAFFEESLELSRRFRALKLWLSLRYHGLNAFREAIGRDLEHAQLLAGLIGRHPDLQLLAPAPLSAVCFRSLGAKGAGQTELNRLNAAILRRLIERGKVYLSNATLRGCFSLRACFVNHRTRRQDVEAIVEEVLIVATELARK